LVTVNTSVSVISSGNMGGVASSSRGYSGSEASRSVSSGVSLKSVPPGHHPGAVAFNANPPPITPDMLPSRSLARSASAVPSYTVGVSTKNFWVEQTVDSGLWVTKSATLLAQGIHCNIWVMEGGFIGSGTATSSSPWATRAQALAAKFDQIYPLETKILGYEYGGDPSNIETYGGKDGDPRVQILVYDFAPGGSTNLAGFYWSKDFYSQTWLDAHSSSAAKTNLAEIFYINAYFMNENLAPIYSTLVHEFQHMINFNVKNVQKGVSSESWYNEMLSMMAEDMISPLIGIGPDNTDHPALPRITGFLTSYPNEGVTTWYSNYESYHYKYAFGAYLARNYGGAEVVKNILANNTTNEASLVAAVNQTMGGSIDFNDLVARFAEAFIFSDPAAGRATFNKTVTKTISGTAYTFTAFDIWSNYTVTVPTSMSFPLRGPFVDPLTPLSEIKRHSIRLQSSANLPDWQTGTLTTVTLNKPANAGVKLFLMIR
jgi:hypothetical protein